MLEIPLILRQVQVKIGEEVHSLPVQTMNTETALLLSGLQNNNLRYKKEGERIQSNILSLNDSISQENLKSKPETKDLQEKLDNLETEFNNLQTLTQENYLKMIRCCFVDYESCRKVINQIPFSYFQEFFEAVIQEMSRTENDGIKKKLAKK